MAKNQATGNLRTFFKISSFVGGYETLRGKVGGKAPFHAKRGFEHVPLVELCRAPPCHEPPKKASRIRKLRPLDYTVHPALGYDGGMAEAYEILTGLLAILEEMDEERHDARYFVLMAAIKRVLDMMP